MKRNTIETVDVKINAIRDAARKALGGPARDTCPSCTHGAHAPYRRQDASGKIVEGCIDAFHGPAFAGALTESSAWHMRPEAIEWRKKTLADLRAL